MKPPSLSIFSSGFALPPFLFVLFMDAVVQGLQSAAFCTLLYADAVFLVMLFAYDELHYEVASHTSATCRK